MLLYLPSMSHRRPHSDIVAVFECKDTTIFRILQVLGQKSAFKGEIMHANAK